MDASFEEIAELVSKETNLTYIGSACADLHSINGPVVFYTHPFCGLVDGAKGKDLEIEASLVKFLRDAKQKIVFVLGDDEESRLTARKVANKIGGDNFFALSQIKGVPSYLSGDFLTGLPKDHPQVVGIRSLATRVSEAYCIGSYRDRCHASTYYDLRDVFANTVVPLGSVFARSDWTPATFDKASIDLHFGTRVDCLKYDWVDLRNPHRTHDISDLTFEQHFRKFS